MYGHKKLIERTPPDGYGGVNASPLSKCGVGGGTTRS
jgi:hypothetical protein